MKLVLFEGFEGCDREGAGVPSVGGFEGLWIGCEGRAGGQAMVYEFDIEVHKRVLPIKPVGFHVPPYPPGEGGGGEEAGFWGHACFAPV